MVQERHSPTALETVLRHDRWALLVLVAVPIAAWIWIALMARDMYGAMTGAAAWMMTPVWTWRDVLLLFAMWSVMMTAMMLPSATPLILLYAAAARRSAEPDHAGRRIYALAAGYLAVWSLFSSVATVLQRALTSTTVLTPMMEPSSSTTVAILLGVAGLYQVTPLKRACLRACRSPLAFLLQHSRTGSAGAFSLGAAHGMYCVGCCWALMLLLFAGGVMNLTVILGLTAWVLVEKITPLGERMTMASGVVLVGAAVWMLVG